jgi:hypothetical protein
MIEAGGPSTSEFQECHRGVPAPPGIVMVAPPTAPRNAERAQCEAKAKAALQRDGKERAAKGIIKAGARKPRPDWPRPPARGCLYRRALLVVYAHTKDRDAATRTRVRERA